MSEIECDGTSEPVCPHCGYEETDAWEICFGPCLEGETEHMCNSCGEEYKLYRQAIIFYSSYKLEHPAPESEGGDG